MKQFITITLLFCIAQTTNLLGINMAVNHVVIPAAGLGTRFLPYTKTVPKELVPIMGKPALQMVIEESINSGVNDFVIIINKNKGAIKDYFSINETLNKKLATREKLDWVKEINEICNNTTMNYVNQEEQLGLGHAILQAKDAITSDYFGIILPDDIIASNVPALKQLIDIAEKYEASVILVQEVPQEKVSSYGVIAFDEQLEDGVYNITELVEKPPIENAPSNLAVVGRYVLSSNVFESLKTIKPGAGGEYQLTDAIAHMMKQGERVLAVKLDGIRFDTGNPQGWLKAVNYYAQQ